MAKIKTPPSGGVFAGRLPASPADRDAPAQASAEFADHVLSVPLGLLDELGSLPDYDMPSGFRISPVIGWIEPPFTLKLDPVEVESAFEVPLSYLLEPSNHQYRRYEFNGRSRDYLAMPYQGRYIWGATAGILQRLSQQLAGNGN